MCQVTHRLTLNARAVYEMDDEQAPAPAKKKKKASSPAKKKGGGDQGRGRCSWCLVPACLAVPEGVILLGSKPYDNEATEDSLRKRIRMLEKAKMWDPR